MQGGSNWLPPQEKTTLKKPSLIRVKVFNQSFSICRTTSTVLVLKFDIDFITLWDDPMEDSSLRTINTSELFEQSALIDADKNFAVMIAGNEADSFFVKVFYWDKCLWEQISANNSSAN